MRKCYLNVLKHIPTLTFQLYQCHWEIWSSDGGDYEECCVWDMTPSDLCLPTSRNVNEFLLEYSTLYSSKQYSYLFHGFISDWWHYRL